MQRSKVWSGFRRAGCLRRREPIITTRTRDARCHQRGAHRVQPRETGPGCVVVHPSARRRGDAVRSGRDRRSASSGHAERRAAGSSTRLAAATHRAWAQPTSEQRGRASKDRAARLAGWWRRGAPRLEICWSPLLHLTGLRPHAAVDDGGSDAGHRGRDGAKIVAGGTGDAALLEGQGGRALGWDTVRAPARRQSGGRRARLRGRHAARRVAATDRARPQRAPLSR